MQHFCLTAGSNLMLLVDLIMPITASPTPGTGISSDDVLHLVVMSLALFNLEHWSAFLCIS